MLADKERPISMIGAKDGSIQIKAKNTRGKRAV